MSCTTHNFIVHNFWNFLTIPRIPTSFWVTHETLVKAVEHETVKIFVFISPNSFELLFHEKHSSRKKRKTSKNLKFSVCSDRWDDDLIIFASQYFHQQAHWIIKTQPGVRYVKLIITCARMFQLVRKTSRGNIRLSIHHPTQNHTNLHPIWHNSCIHVLKLSQCFKDSIFTSSRHPRTVDVFIIAPFKEFQVNHRHVHFSRRATNKPHNFHQRRI